MREKLETTSFCAVPSESPNAITTRREPVSEKLAAAAKASARPAAMPQPAKCHKDCMLNVGCLGAGVQKRALAATMGAPAESVLVGY